MSKTIALLGATGPSGQEALKDALARGLAVRAVVRDPSKIKIQNENLKVFKANIFEESSLVPVFGGCDAVLSCLGAQAGISTVTLYSESIAAIVQAMRETGVTRLVVMSAAMCKDDPSHPWWWRWLARLVIGRILDDIVRMEDYLQEHCADINYTSVRPPQLVNSAKSEKKVLTEEAYLVSAGTHSIPRANVASFMLDCLDTTDFDRKFIAIAI